MKQLTQAQRLFVSRTAETEVAKKLLSIMQSEITAAQWPACDALIVPVIVKSFAKGGVTILVKHSQRTRAGWSKVTFDAEIEKDAENARQILKRAREKIERNNGYVVEAAKVDPVARLAKQIEKLTEAQQRRLFARFA